MRPVRTTRLLALLGAFALPACVSNLSEELNRYSTPVDGTDEPEPLTTSDESAGDEPTSSVNQCSDGSKNGSETSVDCGGDECAACGLNLTCNVDDDCRSGLCNGQCIPSGCANELQDEDESDVDCGGSCTPCEAGLRCDTADDCQSLVCGEDGRCATASCDDEINNGLETGKDCGAESGCGLCVEGEVCGDDGDCAEGSCVSGICAPARCADQVKNGGETSVDCGGDCPACGDGDTCVASGDCASRRCEDDGSGELICQPAACDDRVLNGDEADVDCGGSCEARCGVDMRCEEALDCAEQVCRRDDDDEFRLCKPASCEDEVKNGGETAIDCGGDCEPCGEGESCQGHSDCESNSCDQVCLAAACTDGRRNGSESGPDCGGDDCAPCFAGAACNVGEDCASGTCEDAVCTASGTGAICGQPRDCLSGLCDETCQSGGAGSECRLAADCLSDACTDGACSPTLIGGDCRDDDDCLSDRCVNSVCEPGSIGATCSLAAGCASGVCLDEACAPLDLVIGSEDVTDQELTVVHFMVASGNVDVTWDELAFLYFFEPEVRNNLQTNYESIESGTKMCVEVDEDSWVYSWRSPENGAVQPTPIYYYAQIYDESWLPMENANDHSYVGRAGPNPNIVVCREVAGTWRHVQGNPPPGVNDPCWAVEPDCTAMTCDDPEK